jgi:hypothetical protein
MATRKIQIRSAHAVTRETQIIIDSLDNHNELGRVKPKARIKRYSVRIPALLSFVQSAYISFCNRQTLSRQLEYALANVAPLVHPVFPIDISGSFRASEQTQPRLPESREYENNRFDISRRIATLDLSLDQEDAVPPYNFDGYSSAETVELPVQETSTSVTRRTALGETPNAESLGDWDIGGEREALNLHFKATNFVQDAINSTNAALNGLSAGPGLAAVTPRFAWVCSTVLDYSLAYLMLDKEIVLDEDTESAHDDSFTFGQIDKKDIVIIYHPLESENTPEYSASEKNLRNLLKRRFDSVKLVLVVGVGGVMPDLCPKFDVRLGDIVVSQTFAKDLDSRLTAMCKFRGQASWWVLQAVAKLESQQLMGTGSRWYDGWPKRLPSSAQVKFIQPGHDLLFSRSYKHVHYEPRPSCGNCSNTGIVRRRERNLKTPVVHVGNTFVTKDDFGIAENMRSHPTMKELTAKPLVFTKNRATVVATFPCIIICGVSNYCDMHDQSYWGDYAAFKAAQYAKKLVSVL